MPDGNTTPLDAGFPPESPNRFGVIGEMIHALSASGNHLNPTRTRHAVNDLRTYALGLQNSVNAEVDRYKKLRSQNPFYRPPLTSEQQAVERYPTNLSIYKQYLPYTNPDGRDSRRSDDNTPNNPAGEFSQIAHLLGAFNMLPQQTTPENLADAIINAPKISVETDEDYYKADKEALQKPGLTVISRNILVKNGVSHQINSVVGFRRTDSAGEILATAGFRIKYDGQSGRPISDVYGIGLTFSKKTLSEIANNAPSYSQNILFPPAA